MNDQDDDVIWRGIDRHINRLEQTVTSRLSQRPVIIRSLPDSATGAHRSPYRPRAGHRARGPRRRERFQHTTAGQRRPSHRVAGRILFGLRVAGDHPRPTESLEVVMGEGGGDHLIIRRMGWTCMWVGTPHVYCRSCGRRSRGCRAVGHRGLGRRHAVRTADVGLDRRRRRRRSTSSWRGPVGYGDARGSLDPRRADRRQIAVHLNPHETPAGRTVSFEGNRTGPCPAPATRPPEPAASLEVLTGEGDGDHLISQRMGGPADGFHPPPALPDLAAIDGRPTSRASPRAGSISTLSRQPARALDRR